LFVGVLRERERAARRLWGVDGRCGDSAREGMGFFYKGSRAMFQRVVSAAGGWER